MSLINDALKRASDAEKRRAGIRPGGRRGPKGPEALGPPLEAVKKRGPRLLNRPEFWSAMFTFTLVTVSASFFYSWWKSKPKKFELHVPPGKDPLEMMIVQKPRKPAPAGPIIVQVEDDPRRSDPAATNALSGTNVVSDVPTADPMTNRVVSTGPRPVPVRPPVEMTNAPTLLKPTELPAMGEANPGKGEIVITGHEPAPKEDKPVKKKKEKPFPEIILKGIVLMKDKAIAFVNGRTISVGDRVEGVELVEIGEDYVKLDYEGQVRQFFLQR